MADVGVSIEGIGTDETAGNAGVVWATTEQTPDTTDYTWTDGLAGYPSPGKDSADPRTAEISLGGFVATLHMRPSIRRVLLARQDQAPHTLQADIDDTDTTVDLGETGASGAVYIGSETMLITADNGDGTYTVERAFWSSQASKHDAGAVVYTRPPYYRNRLVTFWVHDGETTSQRGLGYLDDIDTEAGQTRLVLRVEGPLAALQGVTRMRFNPQMNVTVERIDEDRSKGLRYEWDDTDFESVVAKAFDASGNPDEDWYYSGFDAVLESQGGDPPNEFPWVQLDGAIWGIGYAGTSITVRRNRGWFDFDLEGNRFETSSAGPVDDPVYELGFWYREQGIAPYPIADIEQVAENAFQPLIIAGALLCSGDSDTIDPDTLDMVHGRLGLGVGWLFGQEGIDAFIDLANEDRDVEIDQLVLGWDGEPVDVLNTVLFKLLLPYGYWLAPNIEGRLIPRRFDGLTVETLADALDNQIELLYDLQSTPTITMSPGYGAILQQYTAEIGKTPVFEGTTVEGNAVGASARLDKMVPPEKSDLDYHTLETRRSDVVQDIILRQAIFLRGQMPQVTIRANDWELDGLDYSIGEWATIKPPAGSDPVFYDEEGEDVPTADLQDHPYAMLITGCGWNTQTDAYEIDGLLTNYTRKPGRYIAPAAVVKSVATVDSKHVITVKTESDGDDAQDDDISEFSATHPVQLYDTDSALRESTVLTIESITGDDITLSGTFTNTPADGDQIKLAEFDEYDVEDFGTERGWCYLADSDDTLGSENEEADQWQ
ncbi:MAG: hypothetical protein ACLFVJ_22825 [Persicimonas sp.]